MEIRKRWKMWGEKTYWYNPLHVSIYLTPSDCTRVWWGMKCVSNGGMWRISSHMVNNTLQVWLRSAGGCSMTCAPRVLWYEVKYSTRTVFIITTKNIKHTHTRTPTIPGPHLWETMLGGQCPHTDVSAIKVNAHKLQTGRQLWINSLH